MKRRPAPETFTAAAREISTARPRGGLNRNTSPGDRGRNERLSTSPSRRRKGTTSTSLAGGTAGVRGWQYWQERKAQATGDRFVAALDLAKAGKSQEAEAALAEIVKDV